MAEEFKNREKYKKLWEQKLMETQTINATEAKSQEESVQIDRDKDMSIQNIFGNLENKLKEINSKTAKNSKRNNFDKFLNFDILCSNALLKISYVISTGLIIASGLGVIIRGESINLFVILIPFTLIGVRVLFESIIVIFNIHEKLTLILDELKIQNSGKDNVKE